MHNPTHRHSLITVGRQSCGEFVNDACTLSKNCIVRLSLQASHVFHLSPFYLLSLHRATFALSFFFISTLLQFLCFPCRTFSVCRPLSSYTIFFHSAWLSHLLLSLAIYIYLFTHCPPSISFLSFSLCGLEISVLSGCLTQLVARQQQQLVA